MISQVIKELLFLLIACGIGIYTFKRLNWFYRINLFQIGLSLVNYIGGRVLTTYQKANDVPPNNQWTFNIYIFLEVTILLWAAFLYFNTNRAFRNIAIAFAVFVIAFIYQIITSGYLLFANYSFLVGGLVIVSVYIFILFESISQKSLKTKVQPQFWLSLGLIIYFACNAPYIGLIHYLQTDSPELNTLLFYVITGILSNVRYLLIAISFWLCARQSKETSDSV